MSGQKYRLKKGVTIWLTGLSGAGKTTISHLLEEQLKKLKLKVEVLDGDAIRKLLSDNLGFSREDRQKHIARVAYICKLLTRNDVTVIASLISPYRETRDCCRKEIGSFVEVYVKCPLEECIRRDVKGLYHKAINGHIQGFTGISDPYEEPENPEVVVDTFIEEPRESVFKILVYLARQGFL